MKPELSTAIDEAIWVAEVRCAALGTTYRDKKRSHFYDGVIAELRVYQRIGTLTEDYLQQRIETLRDVKATFTRAGGYRTQLHLAHFDGTIYAAETVLTLLQ